ncbi:MAG TPA: 3-methyl-2-oxobutanoate hydroxymethyltransferase [Candidatus Hydrogenedentes bacterium]|nr:3-methyl-2-oxobutanoate hydroxymethyltransferase [Candidatus Hydrogenedentota bacterium]HOV72620.1 3-methyl-2-oxobutanoate hydroxymethyltransferase [Candidatus Hydrogenedentota bacterium]HPC16508.1 3-methyl-2-oxobutanoate hydroxymethyltransferase [Candidatus Hydrogenedentota bacterium]HRT21606.1 3-methyl-2-oxobutanoate hydroxymethyltransferase [Candidatus Hydrogenedentota bacterium]HRT63253.1 3-methyl-2-oxobutanoate hydroxymethyltransferase [Candidatus Hydrogenedentota bacterium]
MPRITAVSLRERKQQGDKIAMLTAYDYPTAQIVDASGVDIVLVGDSCGNVVMGRPNTLTVTMDEMVHHTRMVSSAVQHAMVIGDMPFLSYQINPDEALRNAGRLIVEGGAQGVKLEGPVDKFGGAIAAILRAGIPVMGHIGLTPQSVNQIGGYKVQGRSPECRIRLKDEARGLEEAGCFAIVLECIPADLAAEITELVAIPTIGIGAGPACDGQVLVLHDILGWGTTRFTRTFADVRGLMRQACEEYVKSVRNGSFPQEENQFK